MQNLKTLPAEISIIDDLPPLSVEEQRLIEALGEGLNNSDAYARAYGRQNYSAAALGVQACRKVSQPHIQAHLAALRAVGFARALLKIDDLIAEEMAFAERAEKAGNFGAAGQARDRIYKLRGLYSETRVVTISDPMDTLKQIAQVSPDIAAALANEHNIEWPARKVN